MSFSELRVPFGERDGRLYTPDDVERGLACGCTCPSCEQPLIANKPTVKRNYFSHHRSAECPGGYETALHRMAKQIIEDAGRVVIPAHTIELRAPLIDEEYLAEIVSYPPREVVFRNVVSEQQAGRWRPDLTAILKNGETLYIEVMVTHGVEDTKAESLDNLMEIDLGRITPDEVLDIDVLRAKVLKEASRYWYRCSLYDELPKVKAAQAELYQRASAERERRIREKAEQAREKQAKERYFQHREEKRRPWVRDLEFAMHMQKIEAVNELHSTMESVYEDALYATRKRLEIAGHAPVQRWPLGVDQRLPGDWIVGVHYKLWQAFILEKFVINARVADVFTVPEVVKAVDEEFGFMPWMKALAELKADGRSEDQPSGVLIAEKGAWFLTESENNAIKTPYFVILQYLQRLSFPPFRYFGDVRRGHKFTVIHNRPMERYKEFKDAEAKRATDSGQTSKAFRTWISELYQTSRNTPSIMPKVERWRLLHHLGGDG